MSPFVALCSAGLSDRTSCPDGSILPFADFTDIIAVFVPVWRDLFRLGAARGAAARLLMKCPSSMTVVGVPLQHAAGAGAGGQPAVKGGVDGHEDGRADDTA